MISLIALCCFLAIIYGSSAQKFECLTDVSKLSDRLGTERPDPSARTFPYYFDKTTTEWQEKEIREAIKYYEDYTCLRMPYEPNNTAIRRVRFTSECGCVTVWYGSSISIGVAGCGIKGLLHEIGHVYGWGHEQDRTDRDDALHILAYKGKANFHDVPGVPYDLFSVMQYWVQGSADGLGWATIQRRYTYMGGLLELNHPMQENGNGPMSFNDFKRANFQYWCNETCVNLKTTICENEGYLRPPTKEGEPCKCFCPYGTSGDRCEDGKPKFYRTDMCGGYYDEDAVIYTEGYYEGRRTGDQRCSWIFRGKPGKRVKVVFDDYDIGWLKPMGGCKNGFMNIRTTDYYIGDHYCGKLLHNGTTMVTSVGMDLGMYVNTLYETNGRGLLAHVSYIDPGPSYSCSHNPENVINVLWNSDPIIINYSSEDGAHPCSWIFEADEDYLIIQVAFKEYGMNTDENDCSVDYTRFEETLEDRKIQYTFCNNEITNMTSVGKKMTLSSFMKHGGYFIAEVTAVWPQPKYLPEYSTCNSTHTELKVNEAMQIMSPNYYNYAYQFVYTKMVKHYPPNTVCEWVYEVKENAGTEDVYISVKFSELDIDCEKDKLTLYDSTKEAIQVCKQNQEYKITGTSLHVTFTTDGTLQMNGFTGTVVAKKK